MFFVGHNCALPYILGLYLSWAGYCHLSLSLSSLLLSIILKFVLHSYNIISYIFFQPSGSNSTISNPIENLKLNLDSWKNNKDLL